ncbi:MAG TPA: hypothetical protein VI278_17720 [Nitrososphaeraceae archaeon]|jgi:hypothetical protein
MDLSLLSLLPDFEKMLLDRIEELKSRIHKAHNPIYNETLMIEIETLQWVLSQIDRPKQ